MAASAIFDWTTPKPASQIFEELSAVSKKIVSTAEWETFTRTQLKKAQAAYPKLDLSEKAETDYRLEKHRSEIRAERMKPRITVKEFFETAYRWNPFDPAHYEDLVDLLTSERLEKLPLGKLDGRYQYELMAGMGALPTTGVPPNVTDFNFANAGGGAIAYEDGHPSEANQMFTFKSSEDDKLRRIMPLGWLVRILDEKKNVWERIGHALVMDMDEGRDRHPWIVLANEWPDDREGWENDTVYAEQTVQAGDQNVHGILPRTTQRTPVGRFVYGPSEDKNGPLLLSFGRKFTFGIHRLGGRKARTSSAQETGRGPGLAKIMDWYDDAKKDQLVCYDSDGKEYMRYNKATKEYRIFNQSTGSGSRVPPASRFISLEERFGNISIGGPSSSGVQAGSSRDHGGTGAGGQGSLSRGRTSTEL